MILALIHTAAAATAASPVTHLALGIAGSGESVLQDGLVQRYPSLGRSFSGEVLISAELPWPVEVGLEAGYRRVDGTTTTDTTSWIWYAPVSLVVSGRLDAGPVALLGGVGPSLVAWQEKGSEAAVAGREDWGARWGVVAEASLRYHVPWLPPSVGGVRSAALDVFLTGGARFSDVADSAAAQTCHGDTCGFDWSAMRLSGGVLFRL